MSESGSEVPGHMWRVESSVEWRTLDCDGDGQDGGSGIILAGVWCGPHNPVSSHIHPSGVPDTDITLHRRLTIYLHQERHLDDNAS